MTRSTSECMKVVQMIVPEVDLDLREEGPTGVRVADVPFDLWHYHLNALHSAVELLQDELEKLPDVDSVEESKKINEDVRSLVIALKVFYVSTLKHIANLLPSSNFEDSSECEERRSKYRKIIDRGTNGE